MLLVDDEAQSSPLQSTPTGLRPSPAGSAKTSNGKEPHAAWLSDHRNPVYGQVNVPFSCHSFILFTLVQFLRNIHEVLFHKIHHHQSCGKMKDITCLAKCVDGVCIGGAGRPSPKNQIMKAVALWLDAYLAV